MAATQMDNGGAMQKADRSPPDNTVGEDRDRAIKAGIAQPSGPQRRLDSLK